MRPLWSVWLGPGAEETELNSEGPMTATVCRPLGLCGELSSHYLAEQHRQPGRGVSSPPLFGGGGGRGQKSLLGFRSSHPTLDRKGPQSSLHGSAPPDTELASRRLGRDWATPHPAGARDSTTAVYSHATVHAEGGGLRAFGGSGTTASGGGGEREGQLRRRP